MLTRYEITRNNGKFYFIRIVRDIFILLVRQA